MCRPPLGDDALGARLASVCENGRAILGQIFVEQDARLDIAQQSRQGVFAVEKWAIAQILTIMLDQIDRIEDRGPRGLAKQNTTKSRSSRRIENVRGVTDRVSAKPCTMS